jgi:hypothetical protein
MARKLWGKKLVKNTITTTRKTTSSAVRKRPIIGPVKIQKSNEKRTELWIKWLKKSKRMLLHLWVNKFLFLSTLTLGYYKLFGAYLPIDMLNIAVDFVLTHGGMMF